MEKIWPKAPKDYSASFWISKFSIWSWEQQKIPHFYDFGISERAPLSPKTNMIYLWRPHDTSNNSRKTPESFFEDIIFGNLNISEIEHLQSFGKDWGRKTLTTRLINS